MSQAARCADRKAPEVGGASCGYPGFGGCLTPCPSLNLPRKCCLTAARDITLCSWHPRHPTLTAPGPHQPTSTLTPSQPHRPVELRVSRATAFAFVLATACAPPGTLDLVPGLGPLLGLSTCQPLPGGPSGLQGTDQRHRCPGPVGARGRALSGLGCSPTLQLPYRSHSIHWNRSRASLCSCLGFPQGPHPLWGSGTLHCTGSLHTGGGEPAPPPTPATCGSPDSPAPLGPNTVPSWLGGPEPVSGNRPQGWCRKEGKYRGEGLASAVTSTLDQALLLWPPPQGLVPGCPHPCPGGPLGPGLSGCPPAAPARVGASASGSYEAK